MIRPTSEPLAIRIRSGLSYSRAADDVGAVGQAVGARMLAAIERGHVLARQHEQHRAILHRQRHLPGDRGLVGVGRADHREAGDRAQAHQLFDRLVRRAVLAERDAVVREHVQRVQLLQRGQADRRAHVVGEDQEGRAVRDEAAVRGQAVDDRAHRVLAHAEVQVAAGPARAAGVGALDLLRVGGGHRVEVAQADEVGERGRVEVGRAAHQRRQLACRWPPGSACRPRASTGPWRRRGSWACRRPSPRAARRAVATASSVGQVGEGLRVGLHALVPLALGLLAGRSAPRRNFAAGGRRARRTSGASGQPSLALVAATSLSPSGEPCALKLSCFGRADTPGGCARGSAWGASCRPRPTAARASMASTSLPSATVQRLPAVGLEALGACPR